MADQVLTWHDLLGPLKQEPCFKNALAYYDQDVASGNRCFPPRHEIFNAFRLTPFSDLKVIILGQDPYHELGQAMGLSFSVRPGVKVPPSLVNIYKELSQDIPGFTPPPHGCLVSWARQGVLLLNAILTVREGQAMAHANQGWEKFTDAVIKLINEHSEHVVYLLWGAKARNKCKVVNRSRNLVLECAHPSPLSAHNGFFGQHQFSQANAYLMAHGKAPINWQLPQEVAPEELNF